jgi:hypothetical protein
MDENRYIAGTPVKITIEPEVDGNPVIDFATITIKDPTGTTVVDNDPMTADGLNLFYYVWQSTEADELGVYVARTKISINGGVNTLPDEIKFRLT